MSWYSRSASHSQLNVHPIQTIHWIHTGDEESERVREKEIPYMYTQFEYSPHIQQLKREISYTVYVVIFLLLFFIVVSSFSSRMLPRAWNWNNNNYYNHNNNNKKKKKKHKAYELSILKYMWKKNCFSGNLRTGLSTHI